VVDILLEANAFVNVRNKHGMTPLHLAARKGYNKMIRQLVTEHGALLDAFTLVSSCNSSHFLSHAFTSRLNKHRFIWQQKLANWKLLKLCSA